MTMKPAEVFERAGGCFEGEWNGGGDDANMRHLGFSIAIAQDGADLSGTFDFTFEMGRTGTVTVTGTADCAAGTAELHGISTTGVAARADYKLRLLPEVEGHTQTHLEGTWECGEDCTPGHFDGYRDH